jgi:hypothetical protein
MRALASAAGRTTGVHRRDHDHHLADSGDIEFETLAMAKSRCIDHLDLGQLVIVGADTVNGLRAETVQAPEFADRKFRGVSNATEYIRIAPRAHHPQAGER